jgi:hypothetical protein
MFDQVMRIIFSGYLLGIAFVVMPLLDLSFRRKIIKNRLEVDAIVLRTSKKVDSEGATSYFPVFEYYVEGKRYETRYSTGNMRPKFLDGDKVQIYCYINNPEKVVLPNDTTRKVINTVFIVLGLAIILAKIFSPLIWD